MLPQMNLEAMPAAAGEGVDLHWQAVGQGTPVLLIHGTAAALWGELPQRLAGFARAISYDRRGFGRSAGRPATTLPVHADDAAALPRAQGGGAAVLVGWSIGGVIALEVAARYPQLVRGLVLLEPPLHAKKHPSLGLLNGVVGSILSGALLGAARGGRRFSRWVFREEGGGNSLDRLAQADRAALDANAASVCLELRGGTGEHLSAGRLRAIDCPTVVFSGSRSLPFLRAGARRAAEAVRRGRHEEFAGASHLLQLERPGEIAEAVRQLL
jgi:pimeloyl-ACP methyl ester carboxylesterase